MNPPNRAIIFTLLFSQVRIRPLKNNKLFFRSGFNEAFE